MKIQVEDNYKVIAEIESDDYTETSSAQPTSRLIAGSRDHGYDIEYAGYGTAIINGKKENVKAIYLFEKEEFDKIMEERDGDEGSLDWEGALKRFEIID